MGKTRDLFKKIGDVKGIFHPNMGTIKDLIAEEMTRRHRRTVQKNILMTRKIMMVWSLTQSQTFWSVKSSGP